MRKLLLAFLAPAVLAAAVPAGALMLKASPTDLALRAENIVRGRVVSTRAAWNSGQTMIYTRVVIDVDTTWKGAKRADDTVALSIPGGEVGETGIWVEDMPQFMPGEDVVVFLESDGAGGERVCAQVQGKFAVLDDVVVGADAVPVKLDDFRADLALPGLDEGR
jgi:hypothetical protein